MAFENLKYTYRLCAAKFVTKVGGLEFYQNSEEMNKKYDKTKFSRLKKETVITVFEKYRKSLTQDCERSELRLYFEWTKVH